MNIPWNVWPVFKSNHTSEGGSVRGKRGLIRLKNQAGFSTPSQCLVSNSKINPNNWQRCMERAFKMLDQFSDPELPLWEFAGSEVGHLDQISRVLVSGVLRLLPISQINPDNWPKCIKWILCMMFEQFLDGIFGLQSVTVEPKIRSFGPKIVFFDYFVSSLVPNTKISRRNIPKFMKWTFPKTFYPFSAPI